MEGSCRMIDEFAKDNLHGRLRRDRKALLWKLDGLSEYDARRPLTATGTNLLGLVKHVATVEARYFGEVFDRPSPEPLPRWQDSDGSDLWASEDETRDQIIGFYRRTWEHSDATINELPLDAPGHVPWWPGALSQHEPVRRHGPCPQRVHPAYRARRYPARGPRRPDRGARRTRDADRRGSPCSPLREDRAGRQDGRTNQGLRARAWSAVTMALPARWACVVGTQARGFDHFGASGHRPFSGCDC